MTNKSWSFNNNSSNKLFDLTGTVALITGGNSGIGRGIAIGLAQAGADIFIASRNVEKSRAVCQEIIKLTNRKAYCTKCDVSIRQDVTRTVKECQERYGRLDIIVPNAGVSKGVPKNLHSDQDWDYVVNINLRSVYWLCHDAYPLLKASKRGKIITIGSEYSLHGSMRTIGYAASKHGVIGLTKSLAVSWASDGIQANCIIPGWILTDLAKPAIEHPIVGKAIEEKTPGTKGFGYPEDLAGCAIFLASKASDFVTGQSIAVDGGFSTSMLPHAGL